MGQPDRGLLAVRWDMLRSMRIACAAAFVLAPLFALTGCGDPPEEDTHSYVKVLFARAQSEAESPYTGTTQVQIQMAYENCYQSFYQAFPNWAVDGEDGAEVFGTLEDGGEGWKDRLCQEDVASRAECEVTEFQQLLDVATRLTVTYNVSGPLENRVLLFGPLPTKELADCEGGLSPRVRLETGGTRGLDSSGSQVWRVSSVSASGEAVPGDGAELVVNAAR